MPLSEGGRPNENAAQLDIELKQTLLKNLCDGTVDPNVVTAYGSSLQIDNPRLAVWLSQYPIIVSTEGENNFPVNRPTVNEFTHMWPSDSPNEFPLGINF